MKTFFKFLTLPFFLVGICIILVGIAVMYPYSKAVGVEQILKFQEIPDDEEDVDTTHPRSRLSHSERLARRDKAGKK